MLAVGGASAVAAALGRQVPWPVLLAGLMFFVLGFADDVLKSRSSSRTGFSERASFLKALAGSLVGASLLSSYVDANAASALSLSHWIGSGAAGSVVAFLWIAALLFAVTIGAGFSDGIDGLTTGLAVLSAGSMTVAIVVIHQVISHAAAAELRYTDLSHTAVVINQAGDSAIVALTSACLGFLIFNLPSNWTKGATSRRLAKAYLGDSGRARHRRAFGRVGARRRHRPGPSNHRRGLSSGGTFIVRAGENTGASMPPVRVSGRTRSDKGALFRVSAAIRRRSAAPSP